MPSYVNYKRPAGHLIIVAEIDATATWGEGTVIWHYSIILQEVRIGNHCSIGSRCEIGRGSRIGDYSRIGSGTFLPPNSVIGEYVFIGPNCTFTDDKTPRVPRANSAPYTPMPPVVEDGAAIGAGCVILPGMRIGRGARVAAGTVVTRDVEPGTMVCGEPGRVRDMPPAWAEG